MSRTILLIGVLIAVLSLPISSTASESTDRKKTSSQQSERTLTDRVAALTADWLDNDPDTLRGQMPQIEVIGVYDRFVRIPGSAEIISNIQIQAIAPVSGQEVFRRVPGIHAVEEEGIGLRANIGIRGLDPNKSRSVLMLEDGVPIALAPYGEPEMYYTPSMDRMVGIEVIKGSGSILFGPQTFGGVINYLTANPPAVPTATAHIRGGEGGYFVGRFGYGTTVGNTGFQATYLHKQGDQVGLLGYNLHDFNTKFKMVLADNSIVGVKLSLYDETSNSTYVGLTQQMYDSGLYDFTHLSPDDLLHIRRYSASVTHDYFFSENIRLKTTAFGYTTSRNWSRQDFDNTFNTTRDYARVVGDPSQPFGAIYFRQETGNRNRQFEVLGVEPRLSLNHYLGGHRQETDFGFRYLYERAFEQRVNGTVEQPTSGVLRDDEIRTGRAFSTYLQNRYFVTDDFTVTPGIRLEYFNYERNILRQANENRNIISSDDMLELIPGIGFNYRLDSMSSVYAGIHRGFGPPRTKDAISAAGVTENLDAERSWNFEAGVRGHLTSYLSGEITGFYLNFSNQIIPVAESSGGVGSGLSGLINGGETEHLGVESVIEVDFSNLLNLGSDIRLRNSFTYTKATFSSDRFVSDADGVDVNVKGNTLPYAPEILINTRLDVTLPVGLSFGADGTYIARQFGDPLNTIQGSDDGRQGAIPAYYVINAGISYGLPMLNKSTVSLSVKNLLDERYIVSRRPQGIRVGLPRFISAGFDFKF